MRKAVRVAALVTLCYLVQATMLPHVKIGGVMPDVTLIAAFAVGFALGPYAGLTGGAFAALVMEVGGGDLPGLTAFAYLGAGGFGAWIAYRRRLFTLVGRRQLEQVVRRYGPVVALLVLEVVKETLFLAYFYLTGMDIALRHVLKVLIAGFYTGLAALVLLPLFQYLLLRAPGDGLLARWRRKRQRRRTPKPVETATGKGPLLSPSKGGTET